MNQVFYRQTCCVLLFRMFCFVLEVQTFVDICREFERFGLKFSREKSYKKLALKRVSPLWKLDFYSTYLLQKRDNKRRRRLLTSADLLFSSSALIKLLFFSLFYFARRRHNFPPQTLKLLRKAARNRRLF